MAGGWNENCALWIHFQLFGDNAADNLSGFAFWMSKADLRVFCVSSIVEFCARCERIRPNAKQTDEDLSHTHSHRAMCTFFAHSTVHFRIRLFFFILSSYFKNETETLCSPSPFFSFTRFSWLNLQFKWISISFCRSGHELKSIYDGSCYAVCIHVIRSIFNR